LSDKRKETVPADAFIAHTDTQVYNSW